MTRRTLRPRKPAVAARGIRALGLALTRLATHRRLDYGPAFFGYGTRQHAPLVTDGAKVRAAGSS
jgi:hypothetical protein